MRTLDQISREEWQVYVWYEVTPHGSTSRVFVKGKARERETIEQAASQYDEMIASLTQRSTNQTERGKTTNEHSTEHSKLTSGDQRDHR